MLNESKTTATQKRLARDRQRAHRSRVADEAVQSERDQRAADNWSERRNSLQATSLFETGVGTVCTDFQQQFHIVRIFARKLIVKMQPAETFRTLCRRSLLAWVGSHIRAAGMQLSTETWIWSVRFNYRKEDVEQLLLEMLAGCENPDAEIEVANLQPLAWKCSPARPVQVVDEKVQRAHDSHDQFVQEERAIRAGHFSILDDGNSFLLKADCSETGWKFPRTFPSQQIHTNWNLLALAHRYLQNNPDDERFCPDVRERIARVYTFRTQSIKTNFNRGMEE